ncbi:MAG: 3-deoxy-7-phosphoheptulonate synthase, partial [Prochloraceae cyanobacterium]
MIVIINKRTPASEIKRITQELRRWKNIEPEEIVGQNEIALALLGDTASINPDLIQQISPFIEQVLRVEKPFK